MLLETISVVKKLDVGNLKLQVFEEKKARAMVCQGALWQVDSRIDEVKGNECASQRLHNRFYAAFTKSAVEKMPAEDRNTAEKLVKGDIKKISAP